MRYLCVLLLASLMIVAGISQEPPIPVIRLALSKSEKSSRALKYVLLPDEADQVPGNAAPLWMRASLAARTVQTRMGEAQWKWLTPEDTPLKAFPRKAAREFLKNYDKVLFM